MKQLNIQDHFLNTARKENMSVVVFLTNGFQLKGVIKGFDNFTILLDCDGKQNLIFKHAISTFVPSHYISFDVQSNN